MASFENENNCHRLCLFCCKSTNYSEIKVNYEDHGQGEGDAAGRGDTGWPLVSKIIDSEDSFGGFMEMLGKYSGREVDFSFKLKQPNCCENCLIIINRCGELYSQLKDLEKEIEWKVGSVLEIMKVGSGRMEGNPTSFFGGIRKEIINNCFKMLGEIPDEKMEPSSHKPEIPLPPSPPIMPLPRKREKCVDDKTTDTTTAPAIKKSRIITKPKNEIEITKPKINVSAKAIPLDNNNNSNTETELSSISTIAMDMDTLEPSEGGSQGQGQVTFTLSKLHINKDPIYPSCSSSAASFFIGPPGPDPAFKIMNASSSGARHAFQATTNQIN